MDSCSCVIKTALKVFTMLAVAALERKGASLLVVDLTLFLCVSGQSL